MVLLQEQGPSKTSSCHNRTEPLWRLNPPWGYLLQMTLILRNIVIILQFMAFPPGPMPVLRALRSLRWISRGYADEPPRHNPPAMHEVSVFLLSLHNIYKCYGNYHYCHRGHSSHRALVRRRTEETRVIGRTLPEFNEPENAILARKLRKDRLNIKDYSKIS